MSNHKNLPPTNHGFTLVEMLIVAPMIIIVIGVFIGAIIGMTGEVMMTRGSSAVTYNLQDALSRIENDVKTSGAFLATNNISITTGQGYDDATSVFKNSDATNGTMLILNSYATTSNPSTSATRNNMYTSNQPYACDSPLVSQNTPLMVNIVYFVKNDTLWRRVIMPSNYATIGCDLVWQQPSCSPGYSAVFCKANDIKLVEGVNSTTGFIVNYYQSSSPTTPNAVASDSSQSDSARQAALSTTNNVKVTIESVTTVAGREVKQTGNIRAVTLNNNPKSALITTHPSNSTVTAGANASFSSAILGTGSTVQWQQSTGKDMNWSNISGATSSNLTVSAVTNTMDGYKYRAVFTKGSEVTYSNSAKLTVNLDSWTSFTGIGPSTTPWSDYNSVTYSTNGYRKTTTGVVILKGSIKKNSAISAGEVITTLPFSYRPSGNLSFVTTTNNNVYCRINVNTNGQIIAFTACSNTWVSLEGIRFIADVDRYTENKLSSFSNNWSNYDVLNWAPAFYVIDSIGRVHTQGMVAPGILTDGTLIHSLPTNLLPSGYMHVPSVSGVYSLFGISHTAGSGILAKGAPSSTWLSINSTYYPASPSPTPTWYNLDLTPPAVDWTNYGTPYSTAQCTKATDGLVSLKGLIRNGTATSGTTIARVHASCGYPAKRIIATAASNGAHSRIDIDPSGYIIIMTGSNVWLSLDGITYYDD